ncbi:hypothetical protein EYF80_025151 [Liparis tanakae]|uniref:Uncharacterized protein n=1 Tax=Liparis tanakae TaxID=230148 RepID=A0A4Z2HIG0_9TELE|nr:hypothetical protein EYF80_025151 [Liparis tanakae]
MESEKQTGHRSAFHLRPRRQQVVSQSRLSSSSASRLWSSRSRLSPPGAAWPGNVSPGRKLAVSVTSGEHGGESEERDERGDRELMESGVSDSRSAWILEGPDSAPPPPPAVPPPSLPGPPPPAVPSGFSARLSPAPVTTSCSWMVVMELEGR